LAVDHATRRVSSKRGEGEVVRLPCQRIIEHEESGGQQNLKGVTVGIIVFESDKDCVTLINRDYVWIEPVLTSVAGVLPREKNYSGGW